MMSSQFNDKKDCSIGNLVSQIDIVPTLSVLLGLPIPKSSLGKLIPDVFSLFPQRDLLEAFQINSLQQLEILKAGNQFWSSETGPKTAQVQKLIHTYQKAKDLAQEAIVSNDSHKGALAIENYKQVGTTITYHETTFC